MIINRLHLAAMKSVDEMGQIDQEMPMVEHMLKIRTGQIQALPKRPSIFSFFILVSGSSN